MGQGAGVRAGCDDCAGAVMKDHYDFSKGHRGSAIEWASQETPKPQTATEHSDAMADEFLERAKGKVEAQQHEMARMRELVTELALVLGEAKAQLEYLQYRLKTASGQAVLVRIDNTLGKLRSRQ